MTQLQQFRNALGLTQLALAEHIDCSERAIQIVEANADFGLKVPVQLRKWLNQPNHRLTLDMCCGLLEPEELQYLVTVARGVMDGTRSAGDRSTNRRLPQSEAVERRTSDVQANRHSRPLAPKEPSIPDKSRNRVASRKRGASGVLDAD